ncbi:amelogenin, X isoform [Rhinatrema bivittatum]|uniref:amelogenin, X isoform n=1 Tax=Rhinatrema bivittatum TaxID=194408 RepID=UPI0011267980|nr:amelogenin, X isoform [Rhinatrema bivittatum]
MRSWILLVCVIGAVFTMPLPPPHHPGYVNFSYEVLTPLKWYQSMMRQQYPSFGYEPLGGWLQNQIMPMSPMMPQQHLPAHHQIPQLSPHHPILQAQQPILPMAPQHPILSMPAHQPMLPLPPFQSIQTVAAQQPNHALLPQQPLQPNHPVQPQQPNIPAQPPLLPDMPLEPWPPADKTNQEEQD